MDKKTQGSWLIHHTNKLQSVTNQQGYENTFVSGKAGILLSAISSDNESSISKTRLDTLAKAANVNLMFELPTLVSLLKTNELIDTTNSGIAVLGVTSASVLQHTADIFTSLNPSSIEEAAISLAEMTSIAPQYANETVEELSDIYHLHSQEAQQLLFDADQIGFVDFERFDKSDSILFNGNLFRRESTKKIKLVLDTLSQAEQLLMSEFTEALKKRACIDVESAEAMLGKALFQKTSSIGLFDVSIVSNNNSNTGFVTLPSAFSKYSNAMIDDAFDLAKAFLSSITYGISKSNHARGQIRMVDTLLSALVRGESVGPVAAISQDYRVLELKGVVSVHTGTKKGRTGPMLTLLKKEIGELALQAIRQGDVSEHSLSSLPTAAITSYKGPEENRYKTRRNQMKTSPKVTNDMLSALRTGGV
ncbi:hypothetical protein [Pseudomonas syringae group genomosp. 3]|uniref:hypothetical protein n=1 Tax=Pseudomonas syringae group genomosp. 3 TaxID=251701 RepID=UPI0005C9DB3F|nr:hypothetical protein [Pseudomonas syringae group genomosp. 3]KPX73493.1 Uncharacterized protein ALO84_04432 [Pseudomonas syringae pv. maculicola]RMO84107.1 hypothetical protein ALQ34_02834 [Pseudomonas syringae pv. maculicola]